MHEWAVPVRQPDVRSDACRQLHEWQLPVRQRPAMQRQPDVHERQLPVACLATFVLALGACTPSGIRVDVYATAPLDTLVLYAAVDDGRDRFVIDPRLDGSPVDVSGRALARAPYQILVQRDDGVPAGARVVVAVLGQRGDQDLAWGELEPPQPLPDGEIVVRRIDLTEFTAPPFQAMGTSCLLVPDGRSLGSRDDHDCDGYVAADDCNDEDSTVNPGQSEVCNNGKDDNCN